MAPCFVPTSAGALPGGSAGAAIALRAPRAAGLVEPVLDEAALDTRRGAPPGAGVAGALLQLTVPALALAAARGRRRAARGRAAVRASGRVEERPVLDQLVTAGVKVLERAELARVKSQSETPSEANGGWAGEPREWADSQSMAQRVSTLSQGGPIADFKQFVADRLAGDYDREAVKALIDQKIASSRVMMFSFSTCPFCLKSKSILREQYSVDFEVYECDQEEEGNAVRAELGRMTGRTSMPSVWLGPGTYVGGCNDGGLGGVAALDEAGKLEGLLRERGAVEEPSWWQGLLGGPSKAEISASKRALRRQCSAAPKNGVGASDEEKAVVESAAVALEPLCGPQPARTPLAGVWDLLYCTAPGGSSGKLGPFVGDVTQTFVDEKVFINAVELGALKVQLFAEREVVDDTRIKVSFTETVFSVFGAEVFRTNTKGQGVWKQRYVDADLRVMDTPSLFVLTKRTT